MDYGAVRPECGMERSHGESGVCRAGLLLAELGVEAGLYSKAARASAAVGNWNSLVPGAWKLTVFEMTQ